MSVFQLFLFSETGKFGQEGFVKLKIKKRWPNVVMQGIFGSSGEAS